MSKYYPNIFKPLKIRNRVIPGRLEFPQATNHQIQATENFPSEANLIFIGNLARNGAAIVTVPCGDAYDTPVFDPWFKYDYSDKRVHNVISQMFDAVHFYGKLATIQYNLSEFHPGKSFSPKPPRPDDLKPAGMTMGPPQDRSAGNTVMELSEIQEAIEKLVARLALLKHCGLDMFTMRLDAYLDPKYNSRTDEFGGSTENKLRVPIMIFKRIKEVLGDDFLIEAINFGGEAHADDKGVSNEELREAGLLLDRCGYVDIYTIRPIGGGATYYKGENLHVEVLENAKYLRAAGVKMKLGVTGGFQDPEEIEQVLANGIADIVVVGRGFLCDYEYGKKIMEGRAEDIHPCVRCNRCHMYSAEGPEMHYCTVNPISYMQSRIGRMTEHTVTPKRVAIVGGGPAGMEAAIVAREQGHSVTIFEMNSDMGGQLLHADHCDFKWSYKKYKDYLIRQVEKSGAEIRLGVKATPEMLRDEGFDAVIAATGAVPNIPGIPGADTARVVAAADVYGHEAQLGKRVVVIGGSITGTETGIHLAQQGHEVTVLTRQKSLCTEASFVHSIIDCKSKMVPGPYTYKRGYWYGVEGFHFITKAVTTALAPGQVTYQDAQGQSHTIETDSIVIAGGAKARDEEAMAFYDCAPEFRMIGDCHKPDNVPMAIRGGYEAAILL